MNIKRIKVEGLFRIFTHEILFNDNVTIIMGENGVGKTVTLNLIDAIFNARFDYLMDIEYSNIVSVYYFFHHLLYIPTQNDKKYHTGPKIHHMFQEKKHNLHNPVQKS